MKIKKIPLTCAGVFIRVLMLYMCVVASSCTTNLEKEFKNPPHVAKPWTFWFWINGNVTKEGITNDLEAFAEAGIGGVMWMEVSGQYWAPDGDIVPNSPEWHSMMQWSFKECARLGLEFDMTLDFGYGCGGPHITPEISTQRIFCTESRVKGGKILTLHPARPNPPKELSAWLRPGTPFPSKVKEMILTADSYRDIAILAIPLKTDSRNLAPRIDVIGRDGSVPRFWERLGAMSESSVRVEFSSAAAIPVDLYIPAGQIDNLTDKLQPDGSLVWDAPEGEWIILRMGHDTNCTMTRPCPAAAVGLECDRLSTDGIDAHFNSFLKKIFDDAGELAGKTLTYVHIDSWEAGGQNWTAKMPEEFFQRRGYDITPWLPILLGYPIESPEKSEAFLKDMRRTVNELTQDNYVRRLVDHAKSYGIKFSVEPYGHLCIDNVAYGGIGDVPMGEFWALGTEKFPSVDLNEYVFSSKSAASSGHIYGRPVIGAEAWTSNRAWGDHPYLMKPIGDRMMCDGINRMVFHLAAHQPYENMIPGLTHRRWGEHFNRFNTWWPYCGPWMDYLARCQYMLQQGLFVADVCYLVSDDGNVEATTHGMALDVKKHLNLPAGYDYDVCTAPILATMTVDTDGNICLPSGMRYAYLAVPPKEECLPETLRKITELEAGGARIIRGASEMQAAISRDIPVPDFSGKDLGYIHRQDGETHIYFVSHQKDNPYSTTCGFRVPETLYPSVWDPETGNIFNVTDAKRQNGQTTFTIDFDPAESFLVVFTPKKLSAPKYNRHPFKVVKTLDRPWQVVFDPRRGGPAATVTFPALIDWSQHTDTLIRYYSGTAVYHTTFTVDAASSPLYLNLGQVEVMAHVKLNGEDCGITWKPPYRVELKGVKKGENRLEIEVVNLWTNRMIGDERLPMDANWKDFEVLLEWPDWFRRDEQRPSGRYTFTSCRHYNADTPLAPSGLSGPSVTIETR